jgi:hypothetical protein
MEQINYNFPCNFDKFVEFLLKESLESTISYENAEVFRTMHRMVLDGYCELLIQLNDRFNTTDKQQALAILERVKIATTGRTLFVISNCETNQNIINLSFNDKVLTVNAISQVESSIGCLQSDISNKYKEEQLILQCSNIKELSSTYASMDKNEKQTYFKNKDNWNTILMMHQIEKCASGPFFFPVQNYVKYFDFSDESDEAFNFFQSIFDIKAFNVKDLHHLMYGTRYFDFLMNNKAYLEQLFDCNTNFYQFPFDETNLQWLIDTYQQIIKEKGGNWNEKEKWIKSNCLEYMGEKIKFSSRTSYVKTIISFCDDLKIQHTYEGLQSYYIRTHGEIYYGNWSMLLHSFYGCGFFIKTPDELLKMFKSLYASKKLGKYADSSAFEQSVDTFGGNKLWDPELRDLSTEDIRKKLAKTIIETHGTDDNDMALRMAVYLMNDFTCKQLQKLSHEKLVKIVFKNFLMSCKVYLF